MARGVPRRRFLAAALAAAAMPAWPAPPPGRTYRLGLLGIGDGAVVFGVPRQQFLGTLAQLGYVQGRNLEVAACYEMESPERLFACGRKLAAMKLDAIVTEGTSATLAAQGATRSIPIVTTVGDPVAAGFAQSLRHPGGNITGLAQNRGEIARKQIELLRIMRPRTTAIAILWEPPFPGVDILMRPIVEAAREASIAVHEITRKSGDLASTLERMRALHVDAAFPIGGLERPALEAALAAHVAIAGGGGEDVETGALFAVEPDPSDTHLLAATVVDKLLRGEKASDMPFQSATRYLTTINARTAAALGIGLTPELRMRAARIVE
jgi:putative ABC transport system substrate-binding protein